MDPRRVLTFRAVAHQRSFSRAARELALSQPSVSNQVAALEREIGVRLLERGPGGPRLTREGEILLEHADAIAERFQLADEQLATAARRHRVRLRIGAFPTALAVVVPEAIARVRARYPESRVAVAPDHRLAERPEVRLIDLADEDWTAAVPDGLIVRACRAASFEPNLISLTSDQLAIRGLIRRELAVTLVPELLAEPFEDLALRPIARGGPSRDVYALLPPGGRHPLVAPTLDALDTIAAEVADPAQRAPAARTASA